ncbi:Octanoyltransferase [Gracilaria domingensis]|nr:Octanoyltransferase [Gracilaria domingensis]
MPCIAAYASVTIPTMFRASISHLRPSRQTLRPRSPHSRVNPDASLRKRVLSCVQSRSQTNDTLVSQPESNAIPVQKPCRLFDLRGLPISYSDGWELQHTLVDGMKGDADEPDALVLLEHEPVYTLGTASTTDNVLFDGEELRRGQVKNRDGNDSAPLLVRTERGGEVTYHGPGQLVAYPILNLNRHKKDLHWYLRALEGTVIDMLQRFYGLDAGRKDGLSGVWVGDDKVCAVGLKVSKWITMHGLALNVCTDLKPFERIIPCGVTEHGVSSIHMLVNDEQTVTMERARLQLIDSFERTFGPYQMIQTREL